MQHRPLNPKIGSFLGRVSVIIGYNKPQVQAQGTTPQLTLSADDLTTALTADVLPASASGPGATTSQSLTEAVKRSGGSLKYDYDIIDAVAMFVKPDSVKRLQDMAKAKYGVTSVELDQEITAQAYKLDVKKETK